MAFGIGGLVNKVEGLLSKVDGVLLVVQGLGKDVTDLKAFFLSGMTVWTDIKAGQAEIKGLVGHAPVVAGTMVVPAPPAGAVLVAVPAEHVAKLPDALAAIVASVGAGISSAIPK
jgi:hypothetical protein